MFKNFETYCRLCIHIYYWNSCKGRNWGFKFLNRTVRSLFFIWFCWSNFHHLRWGLCPTVEVQQPMSPWIAFSSAKRLSAMSAMRQVWHLQIGWIYDSCIIHKYSNPLKDSEMCSQNKWWFCIAKLGTSLPQEKPSNFGCLFCSRFSCQVDADGMIIIGRP